MSNALRKRTGFTLIELMLVILLLALLGTVATVAIMNQREGAKKDLAQQLVSTTIKQALEKYNMDIGHYPDDGEGGVQALLKKPSFENEKLAEKWRGPYLSEEQLSDPWNNLVKYELVDDPDNAGQKIVHVSSNGPDGSEGTEDDIKSWKDESQ